MLLPKVIDNNLFKVLMSLIIVGFVECGLGMITHTKIISWISIGFFSLVPIILLLNEFQTNRHDRQNLREDKQ